MASIPPQKVAEEHGGKPIQLLERREKRRSGAAPPPVLPRKMGKIFAMGNRKNPDPTGSKSKWSARTRHGDRRQDSHPREIRTSLCILRAWLAAACFAIPTATIKLFRWFSQLAADSLEL